MWLALALLVGCQEPFGTDRHDLVGFRIAAFTADVGPAEVRPQLAVISEGRPYSDAPLSIRWYWVRARGESAGIDPSSPAIAEGAAPRIARRGDRLAVLVGDGIEWERAEIDLLDREQVPVQLEVERVEDLRVDDVSPEDLTISPRLVLPTSPGRAVDPGGFLRFTLSGATGAGLGRFMATDGTFFELNATTADWAAGDLSLDDEEIVTRERTDPGPVTAIGLWVDGPRTGFAAADVHVGSAPPGVWVNRRFLPTDAPTEGWIWADLIPEDDSPTGLALSDVSAGSSDDVFDASALGCEAPVRGPFDPAWLLEQRCSRDALAGQRVLIRVDP